MVSEMEQADYIILNNRCAFLFLRSAILIPVLGSNQFQQALSTLPVHKIALAATWLEACDLGGKLSDMAPFVIDVTSGVGRGMQRKRFIKVPRCKEEGECESEERELAHPEAPATPMSTPAKSQGRPQDWDAGSPTSGSRSPSPPKKIVIYLPGRNAFTPDDMSWFFKYARFKLERNPDMSHNALIQAIASKVHPISSTSFHDYKSIRFNACSRSRFFLPGTAPSSQELGQLLAQTPCRGNGGTQKRDHGSAAAS